MKKNPSHSLLIFYRKSFGERPNFSSDDYLHSYGKESAALLYASLYFPEFIEIGSSVFLKRNITEETSLKAVLSSGKSSISKIEASFNFIEVGYLFEPDGRDVSEEDELLLALKIQEAWKGRLKLQYPERKFVVEVLSPEETGSTYGVRFFEERQCL